MYVNYQDIKGQIRKQRGFKGNSCKGFLDLNGIYRIISYQTEVYNSKDGLDLTYYSVTTSKLQGIIANTIYGRTLKELRKITTKYQKYVNRCKEINEQPLTLEQYRADVVIGAIK